MNTKTLKCQTPQKINARILTQELPGNEFKGSQIKQYIKIYKILQFIRKSLNYWNSIWEMSQQCF